VSLEPKFQFASALGASGVINQRLHG
jgi:hypothetical protein